MSGNDIGEQRRIRLALVGFFLVIGLVAGVGLYRLGVNDEDDRRDELFRFYLTLVEVAGVGGVAALLLERYKELTAAADQRAAALAAERRRIEDQCRQMFFESRKAYDDLKETRRRLQDLLGKQPAAEAILSKASEASGQMTEAGCALIEPQLRLEALQEQAQYALKLPVRVGLTQDFSRMERVANKVSDALRASAHMAPRDAERVARFLSARGFGEDFKRPYHRIIRILLTGPLDKASMSTGSAEHA